MKKILVILGHPSNESFSAYSADAKSRAADKRRSIPRNSRLDVMTL